jgi:Na+/melibiose symporter-like transporter
MPDSSSPLPKQQLIAYALPALPLAAIYFPIFVFLSEFYADARGVSLASIGVIFLALRVFDAVSDPVAGVLSDRTRASIGRRRLWLILAAPLVAIGAWMLFVPPSDAGWLYLTFWLFVVTLGWTFAMVPYFSWGAEISGDYQERSRVSIWRETLGLTGTIIAALLYGSGNSEEGMMRIALFALIAIPLAVAYCVWRVPEPADHSTERPELKAVWNILRGALVFRRLIIAFFINGAANGIASTLFIFFVKYRLENDDVGGPLLVLYFLSAVVAAPFWIWASKRYSKHRIWSVAMIYAGLIFVWTLALGPGDWVWFALICGLSGAALGADLALPAAMQADLVDMATEQTGSQQTGAFFALWSLATKLSLAISGGLAFLYLDWVGFDVTIENSAEALTGLALLYGIGPIALKLIAVAMMWNFPLNADDQAERRAAIEARRA